MESKNPYLKKSISKIKIIDWILNLTILCVFGTYLVLSSCKTSEENLTSKNIDCSKLKQENALTCCLQFMSVKTGNDSKDVFCSALKDELAESFREKRKEEIYKFCKDESRKSDLTCWDKLNTK